MRRTDEAIYRARIITMRVRRHELEAIDTAARVARMGRSEWLRLVALKAARRVTHTI